MLWRIFCRAVVRAFYRRCEISGRENLPGSGPVLLCANHANALAGAVVLQAVCARPVRPLARSGLFSNPALRPVLSMIRAVPVYRRQDVDADTRRNADTFDRCYDAFGQGDVILIFPEGQSHSDPHLRPLKTGAARMTLEAKARGVAPVLLPVGLNFTRKGHFRASVLVRFGEPVDLASYSGGADEGSVRALTEQLDQALQDVTLNVERLQDLDLLKRVERFFAMRHGKYRRRNLDLRFRGLKRLVDAYHQLLKNSPDHVARLDRMLSRFERLCRRWGIRDYHLTIRYRPMLVTRFIAYSVFNLAVLMPLAAWGVVNSALPYWITRVYARRVARGQDQYDTAKMASGFFMLVLFWGSQSYWVAQNYPDWVTALYVLSLPVSAAAAMTYIWQQKQILENARVFWLFVRRRKLRRYLEARRREIEQELARLVRLARRNTP